VEVIAANALLQQTPRDTGMDVAAEKVEALPSFPQIDPPGFERVEPQAQRVEDGLHPLLRQHRLGRGPAQHHCVVGTTHQDAGAVSIPLPVEVVEIDVGQQRRDDAALGSAGDRHAALSLLHDPTLSQRRMSLSTRRSETRSDTSSNSGSWSDAAEEVLDVELERPGVTVDEAFADHLQGIGRRTARPIAKRARQDIGLKDRSSTILAACCTMRSRTVGMPSGLSPPTRFGMYRRSTGAGR
jgi:hypothetical protein